MRFIEDFAELKALKAGTSVYKIKDGNISFYTIGGCIPNVGRGVLMISGESEKDIRFLYEHQFEKNTYTTDYDDREVGDLMISQIIENSKREIDNIRATYFKERFTGEGLSKYIKNNLKPSAYYLVRGLLLRGINENDFRALTKDIDSISAKDKNDILNMYDDIERGRY